MLQNADKDYITMVTSQGVPKSVVNRRFLLKPSVIPTITVIGMDIAAMFGNAFLVERIFNWPGLSSYGMTAILNKDTNAVCAVVLIIGLAFARNQYCGRYRGYDPGSENAPETDEIGGGG